MVTNDKYSKIDRPVIIANEKWDCPVGGWCQSHPYQKDEVEQVQRENWCWCFQGCHKLRAWCEELGMSIDAWGFTKSPSQLHKVMSPSSQWNADVTKKEIEGKYWGWNSMLRYLFLLHYEKRQNLIEKSMTKYCSVQPRTALKPLNNQVIQLQSEAFQRTWERRPLLLETAVWKEANKLLFN